MDVPTFLVVIIDIFLCGVKILFHFILDFFSKANKFNTFYYHFLKITFAVS